MTSPFDQTDADVRCEWGDRGIANLVTRSDVIIIVDILSFTTSVEIATARGGIIYPYRWNASAAVQFAQDVGAVVAAPRGERTYSLSPSSLLGIPEETRLVLPSPNGSTLSLETAATATLAGCLRNAEVVARAAAELGRAISLIPAGERWPDGSLRPCIEDWIGAGAIIEHLHGRLSPEARLARDAFRSALPDLEETIRRCGSGRELVEMGYIADIELAAAYRVSSAVPRLIDGAYVHIDG